MSWIPQSQQAAWLKTRIKSRWPGEDVEKGLEYLKQAKSKTQAYAVVEAVVKFDDLRKLAEAEYAGVTTNDGEVIREAVSRADSAIAELNEANARGNAQALAQAEEIRQQAEQIRQDNVRIIFTCPP